MKSPRAQQRDPFEIDHLQSDLNGRSVRGATVTVLTQAVTFAVQFGGMAILARLLVPADFGIFGKTLAFSGFITVIRSGGLSLATVQQPHVTHEQSTNLFWLNAAVGVIAAVLMAALSPAMAWFYGDVRVLPLGLAFAASTLIDSIAVQHLAILQRQMRFHVLSVVSIVALCGSFVVAVISAWGGAGFWSLAVQQVTNSVILVPLLFCACRWLPGLPRRGTGVRSMAKTGISQTGFNLLNFFSRNVDNVLVGRFVSDVALGFYSQAYRLLLLPIRQINGPISSVVLPALSRIVDRPARYAEFYYRAIEAIVVVGMPLVSFLLVEARLVVLIALGQDWLPVVPIFQALGLAAFLGTLNVATGWVYTSLGRTDRQLRWQYFDTPFTLAFFALGVHWGALGVAISFSLSRAILQVPSLMFCFHKTPLCLGTFLKRVALPTLGSLVAAGVILIVHTCVLTDAGLLLRILIDSVVFLTAYVSSFVLVPQGRKDAMALMNAVRRHRLRGGKPLEVMADAFD